MKKIISILLVCCTLICLCACKKKETKETDHTLYSYEYKQESVDPNVEGPGGYIPPEAIYEDAQFKVERYESMYRIWEKNDQVYAYCVERNKISRNSDENGYCYVDFDLFEVFDKIFADKEKVYEDMTANEFLVKLTTTCTERYKEYNDPNYDTTKSTFSDKKHVGDQAINVVESSLNDAGLGAGSLGDV